MREAGQSSGRGKARTRARRDSPAGPGAREAACRRLAEETERFPELSLAPLETGRLPERDAALAHAIYDGVVRHWLSLEFLIGASLRQPFAALEPGLRAVLLAGAAQLLLLDRIPPHAALNESVDLAKRAVRPAAGGLANAVLRRIAELRGPVEDRPPDWIDRRDLLPLGDGRARLLNSAILPEEAADRLSIATSHPRWLLDRWSMQFGPSRAGGLALHTLASAPTILNTSAASSPLPASLVPHSRPGHHVFVGGRRDLTALLGTRADLWVQDPGSSRAVESARALDPHLIVDLCAGQGTKTRQLASVFPHASIIATDVDAARYRTLADLWRSHDRVRVLPMDGALAAAGGRADLVLLDVPCSNTGVLARRAEARYRCGPAQLGRLTTIQREVLDTAGVLLAPGGRVLYSTCSIDPEENDRRCEDACRRHGWRVDDPRLTLPAGLPGGPAAEYGDGSFSALLRPQ